MPPATPTALRCAVLSLCMAALASAQERTVSGRDVIPEGPEWIRHAVVYQIYPQTYYDSNGDGIGDLSGIIEKLDYIKSLGVDAIWLNPFFDSPFNDAGYDIRDYYKVAPRYGTNEDARRLFSEAHRRGLKVLFDYVCSYTSIDNPWFAASARQKPSPTSNWYIWTDNVWKFEPDNGFVHGFGQRNGNFLSNFFWSEPALNYGYGRPDPKKPWQLSTRHPDVLALHEEMKKVVRFWMDMGADGFRADMAGALVKGGDPEHQTRAYWKEVRGLLAAYPQAFTVAEWSDPRESLGEAFHADFFHWVDGFNDLYQKEGWRILNGMTEGHSFFDAEGRGSITHFLDRYMADYEATRAKGYIILPLGNHDIARLANRRSVDDLEIIMAFGMTMPGIPFLYYGNEIGMRQLADDLPQIEGCFKPRAGARTPMQWSRGPNLGFSTAQPDRLYLPVDPAADAPNVADEERDPSSLLNRVRHLIALKHTEPALAAYAEFVPLYAKADTYPFVYARSSGKDVILVALNPAARPASATFAWSTPYRELRLLAGREAAVSRTDREVSLALAPQSYAIYTLVP